MNTRYAIMDKIKTILDTKFNCWNIYVCKYIQENHMYMFTINGC